MKNNYILTTQATLSLKKSLKIDKSRKDEKTTIIVKVFLLIVDKKNDENLRCTN